VTPAEALAVVRRVGTVEAAGGTLKIRVPKGQLAGLEPAFEILRNAKTEVLSALAKASARTHQLEPAGQDLGHATALLNQAEVRIVRLETGAAIGIWSDLDSPSIRNALRVLGMAELPIRYLDGPDIPLRYKLRRVPGEPVPDYVRAAMERHPKAPWKIRDQMLGRAWRFEPWSAFKQPEKSRC
jgi:hypothetical protein